MKVAIKPGMCGAYYVTNAEVGQLATYYATGGRVCVAYVFQYGKAIPVRSYFCDVNAMLAHYGWERE